MVLECSILLTLGGILGAAVAAEDTGWRFSHIHSTAVEITQGKYRCVDVNDDKERAFVIVSAWINAKTLWSINLLISCFMFTSFVVII